MESSAIKDLRVLFKNVLCDPKGGIVITSIHAKKDIRKFLLKDFKEEFFILSCPACNHALYIYNYTRKS